MISSRENPNNVGLSGNKRLQAGALEHWQPHYIQWWKDMGPQGSRIITSVRADGGQRRSVRGGRTSNTSSCRRYRWGIFLADPSTTRIGFGDFLGSRSGRKCPGEFRNQLRRLIVTQGDTEPASVEQQRWLGSVPSMYDLRNLFPGERRGRAGTCGRWSTCCTRTSAATAATRPRSCLARQSGNRDKPRILDAFNEPIENWLDFFMFTMFTDRDGKSQLLSLSESSLDPLSRTTRFMLTEEAHHMFVGETGVARSSSAPASC
jgi:benzoyl-CoA 2,3-dioxygenase component B